jgi:hypothetical protein
MGLNARSSQRSAKKPATVIGPKPVLFQSLVNQLAGSIDSYSFERKGVRVDACAMGRIDMGQDPSLPVRLVGCDDTQVVAEIHVELVEAFPERFDQGGIARVKLGLIEAEYEWAIVRSELAKALHTPEAKIIDLLRRGIATALVVGRIEAKQRNLLGFKWLGAEPFHGGTSTLTVWFAKRVRSEYPQPRLLTSVKVDAASSQAEGQAAKRTGIGDQLGHPIDPGAYLRLRYG